MTDELRANQVYRLDLKTTNAYLVDDGEVTLIDAGTPMGIDTLRAELREAGYDEADVDRVLVTHFDLDHVGGLSHLAFDGPIFAMEPDASFLDGSAKPSLSNHKGVLQRLLDIWLTRPSKSITRLADGAVVGGFTAFHTPGHTPGHAVYVHENLGAAFLGDLVAGDDGALKTPPRLLAYSSRENAQSVRNLAARHLSFEIAGMGHGNPIVEGGDRALDDLARRLD